MALPELFGGKSLGIIEFHQLSLTPCFAAELSLEAARTADVVSQVPSILTATRFEQVRLFRGWLLPILKKAIAG